MEIQLNRKFGLMAWNGRIERSHLDDAQNQAFSIAWLQWDSVTLVYNFRHTNCGSADVKTDVSHLSIAKKQGCSTAVASPEPFAVGRKNLI